MEQIENKMVLDYYWEKPDWEALERYYEYQDEESDRNWRDLDD